MTKRIVILCVLILLVLSPVVWPISFLSMTQWTIEDGGNGHWYGVMDETLSWGQAGAEADAFMHGSYNGYLATVSSAAENNFIYSSLISGVTSPDPYNEFWLGGRETASGWGWETGEDWSYTNWDLNSGEPRGGTYLSIRGDYTPPIGGDYRIPSYWNDAENIPALYSIVEWGANYNYLGSPPVSQDPNPDAIPEPATMLLMGTGLLGIAIKKRRKRE